MNLNAIFQNLMNLNTFSLKSLNLNLNVLFKHFLNLKFLDFKTYEAKYQFVTVFMSVCYKRSVKLASKHKVCDGNVTRFEVDFAT